LPQTRSAIRWFNDHEIAIEMVEVFTFEKVMRFCSRHRRLQAVDPDEILDEYQKELAALDSKLHGFFTNPDSSFKLQVELVLLVHYGRPLASACYSLEGDGPTLPLVQQHLLRSRLKLRCPRLNENVELDAAVVLLLQDQGSRDDLPTWIAWCWDRIRPAYEYLARQEMKHEFAIRIAVASSLWQPWRFIEQTLLQGALESKLRRISVFSDDQIKLCLSEMNKYKAAADGVDTSTDLTAFWKSHTSDLPGWSSTFFVIGLIQASSGCCERGFSRFQILFGRNSMPQVTEQLMQTQMKACLNEY
jgi:hypothetical protein